MSYGHKTETGVYAMVAEFVSAEHLLEAAEKTSQAGYRKTEGYSPFPVHGLSDALRFHEVVVPWLIICIGICGGFAGFTLEWYTATIDLPLDVGGKPLNSLPSFFPVTFEVVILWASLAAFFGVWALNGLPRPYHSIFNTPGFQRASKDRFFLAIEKKDPLYDSQKTKEFMESLGAVEVNEVEL